MTRSCTIAAVFAVLGLSTSGCALLSKSEPLTPRYFSPEPSGASAPRVAAPAEAARELRLGRVTAASYLGERLVFRDSSYELGFYDDRRWTEKPDIYLRRALSRALFEEGGIRRVVSGVGPTLEVELVEFAELRAPAHVARVRVAYVLYDTRSVQAEATVSVDLPIPAASREKGPPEAVRVLAAGLSSVVNQIVDQVTARLEAPPMTDGATVAR